MVNVGHRVMVFNNAASDRERPYEVSAEVGSMALARTFTAGVMSVRGAGAIIDPRGGNPHVSTGVWVIVTVRAASRDEPVAIGFAGLRDAAGRVYWASERVKQDLRGGRTLQPGIRVEGEIAFEVPRAAPSGGLTVLLAKNMFERRMEDILAFKLDPVDAATVTGWAADKKATLTPTKVLG
ncbi:hypothetical protein GCM10009682_59780 [Luedemannella flava]|uniref:DUF4352 domain-containing protein n=1 Tax=Luedemannella flava TaxID=349316 RepID=A0ABP4YZT8_9ACTN